MSSRQRRAFLKAACKAIQGGDLIPIIGDTIRNEHIFDVDNDDNIGLKWSFWEGSNPLYLGDMQPINREAQQINAAEMDIEQNITHEAASKAKAPVKAVPRRHHNLPVDFEKMNITEELAYYWVKSFEEEEDEELKYPLADSFNIARVAQYLTFFSQEYPIDAKSYYLEFLKKTLLKGACEAAKMAGNEEEIAFIAHLRRWIEDYTFSDLVTELDFPRFKGKGVKSIDDPLYLLANLNQKLYITTSYHDFIERELEAANKKPRTRICRWHDAIQLRPEYVDEPGEWPTVEEPIVFHLFGIEQSPESLVLSENDYLDLLLALGRDQIAEDHEGLSIIPPYVERGLKNFPLLLLGYRLHDWDLRVILRGLCRMRKEDSGNRNNNSMAIQIDIKKQPLVVDATHAETYLRNYYGQQVKNLSVEFDDSTQFVKELWAKYRNDDCQ